MIYIYTIKNKEILTYERIEGYDSIDNEGKAIFLTPEEGETWYSYKSGLPNDEFGSVDTEIGLLVNPIVDNETIFESHDAARLYLVQGQLDTQEAIKTSKAFWDFMSLGDECSQLVSRIRESDAEMFEHCKLSLNGHYEEDGESTYYIVRPEFIAALRAIESCEVIHDYYGLIIWSRREGGQPVYADRAVQEAALLWADTPHESAHFCDVCADLWVYHAESQHDRYEYQLLITTDRVVLTCTHVYMGASTEKGVTGVPNTCECFSLARGEKDPFDILQDWWASNKKGICPQFSFVGE